MKARNMTIFVIIAVAGAVVDHIVGELQLHHRHSP